MPHDIVDQFSTHLKNVLTRALCFVVETNGKTIEPEHLLWALGTQRGSIGAEILKKSGIKQTDLRLLVGAPQREKTSTIVSSNSTLQLSHDAKRCVEKAVLTANIYGHRYVGTEHLLSGILQIAHRSIDRFFAKQKTDMQELRDQISLVLKSTSKFPEMTSSMASETPDIQTISSAQELAQDKLTALEFFGRELTTNEAQSSIDPVIGRTKEIDRLMQILCRRTKNNPLLSGAPGVGKTAIVEGLAKHIVEGTVPAALQHKRIFALDMTMMVAGTMYRGEFEGRLRQVIEEVKRHNEIILFIDEIHTIVGAGATSGSMDAANILKPALARGDIRCIGATTPDEYKKHIESDSALERRFQTIVVDEPSTHDSVQILQGLAPFYEQHHHVRILPEAITHAVKLSCRYIQDRQLPDKAIDLIDEAASAVRIANGQSSHMQEHQKLEQELRHLRDAKRQAVIEERFQDAVNLKDSEDRIRHALETLTQDTTNEQIPSVTAADISEVIAHMMGIPHTQIHLDAPVTKETFYQELSTRIFGQDPILHTISATLARAHTGINHPKRPLASLLFAGPSGVGKTELAKAIAHVFFHDPKHLIRLDMSEYAEGFTVSKLIGSPAGYIGYKDQSNLTDRVKQHPYSVILFDEMEKAHRDIQNLLLQILEEGELTDATGKRINFRNTMIIITTNVGADAGENAPLGFSDTSVPRSTSISQDMRQTLEERFRPELLNRLDTLCVFDRLDMRMLTKIIEKELIELTQRLHEEKAITLTIHPSLFDHLAKLIDQKLGARSVRQVIQKEIETPIAQRLTKKDRPDRLHIDLKKSTIAVTKPRP